MRGLIALCDKPVRLEGRVDPTLHLVLGHPAAQPEREVLLHGARTAGLTALVPRTPQDHSRDEYSKQTAVYATDSSGVWQIGIGPDSDEQYWSQVDRLAGGRANPVLPG